MDNKVVDFLEHSFLKPLLENFNITDISFNGISVFYVDNVFGRKKSDIVLTNKDALDFLRQIANFTEKQFSYSFPILDVSVGKYRINAVHPSIVKIKDEKGCSFSIRISSEKNRILADKTFLDKDAEKLLVDYLNNEESIIIAGSTGTGKTELQKYLLMKLKDNSRVIVIDNVQELENLRVNENLDLTSWQISSSNNLGSLDELIRNGLRSNPDWLVIAESRGKEMNSILNSAFTGHPVITTIHAKSIFEIPTRICRMVEMANINQKHEDILDDIYTSIKVFVFLKKKFISKKGVIRYVESIAKIDENKNFKVVYKKEF